MPRALIVDDEADNRELLARLCNRLGFATRQARHGREALAMLRAEPSELVLLDLMMPELDGLGLLRELRDEPLSPRPAVIVISAKNDPHGRVEGTELGAIDFVDKPFRVDDVERRLQRALAVVELEQRLAESEAALAALRRTDETTGAGRPGRLYGVLEAQFRAAELAGKPLSCVLIADDGYSRLLSERGSAEGERRLQELMSQTEILLSPTDFVFRMDAAELVVLSPATDARAAHALATALFVSAQRVPGLAAGDLAVAVASYPHPAIDQASALYRAANIALAQARSRSEQRLVVFERF